jgi:hypothetical protein
MPNSANNCVRPGSAVQRAARLGVAGTSWIGWALAVAAMALSMGWVTNKGSAGGSLRSGRIVGGHPSRHEAEKDTKHAADRAFSGGART